MNNGLYCNKWINISGWIFYQIPHGQVIWCEGRICVSLYKEIWQGFPQWVFQAAVHFSVSSCCFSILDTFPACMGNRTVEFSRNSLPAHSFHLLPGTECFQIFSNLPNILWETNPQESCQVFGLGLFTVWSISSLFSPIGLRVCLLSSIVCAYVGFVSLK